MLKVHQYGFTLPISRLGYGLHNYRMNIYVPNVLYWAAGLSSALHLLRQTTCLKNSVMTWFYGMFNAAQYLNPMSEKLQDYLQDQ